MKKNFFLGLLLLISNLTMNAQTQSTVCNTTGSSGRLNWVGLAHYYTGDSTLKDLIGGADLVNLNSTGYANGIINKGFHLNGNNQYYLLPNNTFIPAESFTISMWFKIDVLNYYPVLFNSSALGNYLKGIYAEITTAGKMEWYINSGSGAEGGHILGTTTLSPSTWYHLLLIYQNDVKRTSLYINNYLEAYTVGARPDFSSTQIQSIGAFGYTNTSTSFANFFNGTIDEVALFNRALTQDERAALYNAGAGKQAPY